MIRKRLLSACLALALCLNLLPVTALAADGIELYVGGQQIKESGCYENQNGTWTKVDGTEPASGQFYYDAATATLTLNQAKIVNCQDVTVGGGFTYPGSVIAFSQSADVSLTIEVSQGTSNITGTGGIRVVSKAGDASLSISGPGSLEVKNVSNDSGIVLIGSKNVNLGINSADVTISNVQYYGVQLAAGDACKSTATINDGNLTVSDSVVGIYFMRLYTSGPSSLTVSGNAMVDTEGRTGGIINGSPDSFQIGADGESGGIVFNGKSGTVYGNVTLQDDLEIKSGESLTVGKDATLTVPEGTTLTNNGTVTTEEGGTLTGNITNAPPKINTEGLSEGTVNTEYNQTLAADNNPTSWSVTNGALPNGLTLENGTISGTPTAAGTSTFTVKANNNYGSDSKSLSITIGAQTNVPVTGVTLNKSETTLTVGGTDTLTATITPDTATNKTVTWTSSNPNVATVDNGVVRAVGNGSAVITAKAGEHEDTCTVYVTPYIPPVPSYLIQLPEVEGGTVTADRATARQGTEVALTVTPDEGFALASLAVTDFFGNQVDISRNSDGTYSFVMPASQVTVSAVFAPAQLPFTDVTEANWYYDEVYYVWANGLMQGTSATTFGPNVDTTRAMVVTILWRLEGEPASGYDMDYSDVAGGAWYAGAVRWATEHGIVNGSEGQFYPGGTVTREQLAAMLYRYAQYKGYDLTAGGDLSGFADADAVSGWAETSLAWAVGQGLLQGSDSQVDPQGSAIRAQTAAILMRFCENMLE